MEKQHTTRTSLMQQVKDADKQLCLEHNIDHSTSWQPTPQPQNSLIWLRKRSEMLLFYSYMYFLKKGELDTHYFFVE